MTARNRAALAWRLPALMIHQGNGPGRHPFRARRLAPASPYCERCGQERELWIHQRPKRRRSAAFGVLAALFPARKAGADEI